MPAWIGSFLLVLQLCTGWVRAALNFPAAIPTTGYSEVRLLPGVLTNPVVTLTAPPGDTRLFIAERNGFIRVHSHPDSGQAPVFLDLSAKVHLELAGEHGLCGLTFHPGYATNGQFFVFYSWRQPGTDRIFNRLSRFHVDPDDPGFASPDSEEPLISQFDRHPWHNSGDLHFGPDGYLYVSLGDEGEEYGYQNAGLYDQNFFSGILRIDVDGRPGNVLPTPHEAVFPGAYLIPADNPYLGRTQHLVGTNVIEYAFRPERLRGEFWAVGFRNPWRMSFDPLLGTLYVNDVGVASREEVNIVVPGGHYGWFMKEGTLPWPFGIPSGLIDPAYEYEHTEGRLAITGSLLYRGSLYPELNGHYLFTDFSGQLSVLRRVGPSGFAPQENLVWESTAITLGVHPATGEILVGGVGVHRLQRVVQPGQPLPQWLSDTGIYSDIVRLTPAPGVIAYEVNQPFWSDNTIKRRWFALPSGGTKVTFSAEQPWDAPPGTVWIKQFDHNWTTANPALTRRLETRVLVRTTNGIYGASYRWDRTGSDAELVPEGGLNEGILYQDGPTVRTQQWRFPSRNECLSCHTPVGGHSLSFNTAQLNRPGSSGTNQLLELAHAGVFEDEPDIHPNLLPAMPSIADESVSVDHRIAGYFAANCSPCHQPGGPTRASWDARFLTPQAERNLIGIPTLHQLGDSIKLVDPGATTNSALHQRVASLGLLHMPPLGTFMRNDQAVRLLDRWITHSLPAQVSYTNWVRTRFEEPDPIQSLPSADPDNDGDPNYREYLLGTDPLEPSDVWKARITRSGDEVTLRFTRKANRAFVVEMTEAVGLGYWFPVDHPANRVTFPATDTEAEVPLPTDGRHRFFRVRVFEP